MRDHLIYIATGLSIFGAMAGFILMILLAVQGNDIARGVFIGLLVFGGLAIAYGMGRAIVDTRREYRRWEQE